MLSPQQLNITPWQYDNLKKLAKLLATVSNKQFNMNAYQTSDLAGMVNPKNDCGTVACAAGWLPAVVTPTIDEDREEHWLFYIDRVTGLGYVGDIAWSWCFDSDWDRTDNTASGAAKRILYLLEFGVPEDAYDQIEGAAPLCYK